MINRIISYSLRNPLIILLVTIAMTAAGIYSYLHLPIDAVPDITNNQVQVITTSPALAPQEVEKFITFPVEIAMANLQGVTEIRSISRFGLSVVTIVFNDQTDPYLARQMVSEQIIMATHNIPTGYGTPEMMPVTTGLGEIYQYVLTVDSAYKEQYDAMTLRTIQEWIVKRQLSGIPGIVEISSFGGYLKQYEVALNPRTLVGINISINEIFNALEKNNRNTGGSYIEKGPRAWYIRAEGLIESIEDINNIVIKTIDGTPVLIRDVAQVRFSSPPRFGAMTRNGEGETVGGITLMLKGANSDAAIEAVKTRMQTVETSLPDGVHLHAYLDRSRLIKKTTSTVANNLLEGGLIVIFFLILLLGSWRSGIIVASVIPLSMLFAFIMMYMTGISANLMSLGAIDFGLIVDGAVIVVEGIIFQLHNKYPNQKIDRQQMQDTIQKAGNAVGSSATFGVMIILIVYLPIFAFTGIEGKMFKPMAQTVSFALLGALILSLTYVPVVASIFLKKDIRIRHTWSDAIMQWLHRMHQPILKWALHHKIMLISIMIAILAISSTTFVKLGGEFIPTLEEGDLAAQMSLAPGSSLSHSIAMSTEAEKILIQFPEVTEVVSKIGTAEIPTDPMAIEDADIMIILKEKKLWTTASNRETLVDSMKQALSIIPGVTFDFQQPIQLRFNELMTGVKSDIAIKIYGDDLDILSQKANEAALLINNIQGIGDLRVERSTGLPQLRIKYKRNMLALYKLNIEDINRTIRAAFAGEQAGVIFEGERRFDLVVRLQEDFRQNMEALHNLRVSEPHQELVLLNQVATISRDFGPMQISRDATRRFISIGINVRNRDIESLVDEIDNRFKQKLKLPPGYTLSFGGQFENLQAARQSSAIAVPAALLLIFIILYFAFGSLKEAAIVYSAIPLAVIGGIWALKLRGMPFSISAGVGFIALFGIAVLNGIVLITHYRQLAAEGITNLKQRVIQGTRNRLRPVMLTASTDALGFLPMAISNAPGAEVQKPLATVVIGGLITATFLTLVVLPALYILFHNPPRLKINKKISVIILFILTIPAIKAQQLITLEQAIDTAITYNPELENARLYKTLAHENRNNFWMIPATEASWQQGQINSTLIDYNWEISQTIPFPLRWFTRSRVLRNKDILSKYQYDLTESQLIFEIQKTYTEWIAAHQQEHLLKEKDTLFSHLVQSANILYATGSIDSAGYLETVTLANTVTNERLLATVQTNTITRQLQLLLHNNATIRPASLSWPITSQTYFTINPALNIAQTTLEFNDALIKEARHERLPSLSVGYFNQSIDKAENFKGWKVGVAIPLFPSDKKTSIKTAIAEHQQAINTQHITSYRILNQIKIISLKQEQLKTIIEQYNSVTRPWLALLTKQIEQQRATGLTGYVDYLRRIDLVFSTRLQHIIIQKQYYINIFELQYLKP